MMLYVNDPFGVSTAIDEVTVFQFLVLFENKKSFSFIDVVLLEQQTIFEWK